MHRAAWASLALIGFSVSPVEAQQAAPSATLPPPVEALRACRAIADDSARFACLEQAAAALDAAIASNSLIIVTREEARETRRSLFGFNLPRIRLFERDGTSGDEAAEEEFQELTAGIADARQRSDGRYTIRLDTGAVWQTVEPGALPDEPRSGEQARIRRGALGSFMMNIEGRRAIRVRRVE